MEKIDWKVEGMTCGTCALSVSKYLDKKGMHNIKVNVATNDVSFEFNEKIDTEVLKKGLHQLGYTVVNNSVENIKSSRFLNTPLQKFWFCFPFTILLMSPMISWHLSVLMNPWLQLFLCLPVFITGMAYFGKSAYNSLKIGVPNMNVLIALGASSAFIYSLILILVNKNSDNLYFDSAATIITVVFFGYWLEERSVAATQKQLKTLAGEAKVLAKMIAFDDEHKEQIFTVDSDQLRNGDLVLINSGDKVPADCKILWGNCLVNESLLTGESVPLDKHAKDYLIGGSVLESGTIKAQVSAVGSDTILAKIVKMATEAQSSKPPIQRLADRISSIFVPAVILMAIFTFLLNFYGLHLPGNEALMRSIAVLVIACPCAMGIATPAAIAVGLGRAAKNGILFKDPRSIELFSSIKQIVFDKTGTLTTGHFKVIAFNAIQISDNEFKDICSSLEKYSSHPLAKAISNEWKTHSIVQWKKVEEIKGAGIVAHDKNGNVYKIGSKNIADNNIPTDDVHNIYVFKNDILIGWIDVMDEIRPEAKSVVQYFKEKHIRTIVISGDHFSKCQMLTDQLGIDTYYAEKTPEEKKQLIKDLVFGTPTAMIGDGINDAAALATATIGISIASATELARQHAQVILMNNGIQHLPLAMELGKQTYLTIKQNLFWAFIYNLLAIPIAAFGFLNPGIAALAMGFSDVILAVNSLKLKWKKLN